MKSFWGKSLLLSVFIHGALLAGITPWQNFFASDAGPAKQQIREVKIETESKRDTYKVFEGFSSVSGQKGGVSQTMPAYIDTLSQKLIMKPAGQYSLEKQAIESPRRNEIVISDISTQDMLFLKNNPGYLSYYNAVRSKFQAMARKLYTVRDTGDVRLTFVIARDGSIREVSGVSENDRLKELSERIAMESAPFPGIPKEVSVDTCRFSITVQFKEKSEE